jgi:hypothetical protein
LSRRRCEPASPTPPPGSRPSTRSARGAADGLPGDHAARRAAGARALTAAEAVGPWPCGSARRERVFSGLGSGGAGGVGRARSGPALWATTKRGDLPPRSPPPREEAVVLRSGWGRIRSGYRL